MRENPVWNILAALFLTTSITMLTDFTHRMLAADPDGVGIFSVSVQALLAVGASSTFTKAGWSWIQGLFLHFKIRAHSQPKWKLLLAAGLFTFVFPMWVCLPSSLASYYNDRGYRQKVAKQSAEALKNYLRAIALDPRLARAHFDLGVLYETSYQYDKAASEFQQAIVADHSYLKGYNNLSRVLLIQGNSMNALRVTDDAIPLLPPLPPSSPDPSLLETAAALYKNRAWAEYQLGFYEQGVADAKLSLQSGPNAAATYCLLGKLYGKLGKPADAQQAWDTFNRMIASPASSGPQPAIEPDCRRLAQGESHEAK